MLNQCFQDQYCFPANRAKACSSIKEFSNEFCASYATEHRNIRKYVRHFASLVTLHYLEMQSSQVGRQKML